MFLPVLLSPFFLSRISIGSCSLGAAQACFDLAKEYVGVRKQFGQPISNFQNIQFKLADMATDLQVQPRMLESTPELTSDEHRSPWQAARLFLRQAAQMMDDKDANASAFCAMVRTLSGSLAVKQIF